MTSVNWKIDGMSCSTCALTIRKYLEKKGLQNVKVNLAGGDVSFEIPGEISGNPPGNPPGDPSGELPQLQKGIEQLGYTVRQEPAAGAVPEKKLNRHLRYLLICLPFTLLLWLEMAGRFPVYWFNESTIWLMDVFHLLMMPWVQLFLCLPVYIVGMSFFGGSALKSIANGMPNMNVLIAAGATAAFVYSLAGTLLDLGPGYQFYETAASIITIVFLGYYIEDASIRATQKALDGLVSTQKTMANMIAFDDQHQEVLFPMENTELRSGDLVLIRTGELVPADCKILWGEAGVDEAIMTGESLPVDKKTKDLLIGGSLLVSGTVKAQVTAASGDSVLAGIVRMVQQAQGEKPPVQLLADRISAIFVPVVLVLSLLTLGINFIFLHAFAPSLMRGIAVLVIACPCAMGLATPAAIAVGLGRAARQGILFRKAGSLESFRHIHRLVFDKTGTLTTGDFTIAAWGIVEAGAQDGMGTGGAGEAGGTGETGGTGPGLPGEMDPEAFRQIVLSLEKYSTHPIARSITREWKKAAPSKGGRGDGSGERSGDAGGPGLRWLKIEEVKGLGMRGETKTGDIYWAGSYKVAARLAAGLVAGLGADDSHNVYIVRNEKLLGWIDVRDQVRPEAAGVVRALHAKGIHTILLSGDKAAACRQLAADLGIDEVYAEQDPAGKLEIMTRLSAEAPTAMVGDGINDAPALARATVGISLSDAAQLAMQTADVVLMNQGLRQLPAALGLGRHTFSTIRQNLFWAFFYNIIALPVAAAGLLTPAVAALVMGFSDVVLAINSIRLFVKKVV